MPAAVRQGAQVSGQQGSAHHLGRALEVHTLALAPLLRRSSSASVLLVRPDAHRAFAWAAELASDTPVTILVLPREVDRRAWEALIATRGAEWPLGVGGGAVGAVGDGVAWVRRALGTGRLRIALLEESDELLIGRPGDVLALTDADGGVTVVLRTPDADDGADLERVLVLDGREAPGVVGPLAQELRAAAVRLLEGGDAQGDDSRAPDQGMPGIVLRDYQIAAVEAWFGAGKRGVLSMATGSGKTVTAIACTHRVRSGAAAGLVIVVTAPLIHLVEQWADELERLLGTKVVRCHTSRAAWLPAATNGVNLVRSGSRPLAVLVATHETAALAEFTALLKPVRSSSLMIVADESHHLDGERTALLPQQAGMRLGLTATPAQALDDDDVAAYLGPVVTEYPLAQAIADGVLCPYEYVPMPVRLTDGELEEFSRLSELLASALQAPAERRDRPLLQRLMQQRSELLDSATGKIQLLSELLDRGAVRHTIIYCSGREQLAAAQKVCWDKGINAHPFTGEESATERRSVLEGFAAERIPALVAIRCLDEGVDVPPARRAIMLRSSANPTQSVQRRGRLLRRHEGKTHAIIEDLVAVGPDGRATPSERERVLLFAADAMNGGSMPESLVGAAPST